MLNLRYLCLISLVVAIVPMYDAEAANPNLSVSAENDAFGNRFAGSMVVEVVVNDPRLSDVDSTKGEPDVTINGQQLRMTQTSGGSWHAYFAHAGAARAADATVGLAGEGLDFGVFCGRDTPEETFGVSFTDTEGFAVPSSSGLSGFADGTGQAGVCTGEPGGGNENNVVRNAKSLNKNSAVPTGQTGLNPAAWPLIQLYTFNSVTITYNGGSLQQVQLEYDEIPNISLSTDRETYPAGAEVFVTISDMQLNQDPTDEDSWTFGTDSVFYRAYDDRGSASAAGGPGLVNLLPHLSSIGFENNGRLEVDLGPVLELRTNSYQPDLTVTDGTDTFSEIVTFVETSRNSGVFDATDTKNKSIFGIIRDSQRGMAGYLTYDNKKTGILTGSTTATFSVDATLSVGDAGALRPGTRNPIILYDPDQNLNSDRRESLDVSNPASIIPTLKIGSPLTLAGSTGAEFYTDGGAATLARISTPDRHSERLFVDTSGLSGTYDGLTIDTGIGATQIASVLVDSSRPDSDGTSWLNYDIRSLAELGDSLADASIRLEFGAESVLLAGPGLERQAFVQLGPDTVSQIAGSDGTGRLVIDLGVTVPEGTAMLPLVADFVSIGVVGSRDVNNAIYRFELEETSRDSSTFEGTIEYSVVNQINIFDPGFIGSVSPISDRVRLIVTSGLTGKDGLFISYSDLDAVGVHTTISSQPEITTHTGTVSSNSKTFRFGQTVIITVNDPDLNLRDDISDVYTSVNDPNSEIVDTVGHDGVILLEVFLKDVRYKRCIVDGVTHDGLGSIGFSLVETGSSTGVFEGSFGMPSQICNRDGTGLMSPAGGSLDVKYHDARDSSGSSRVASLIARTPAPAPLDIAPHLSSHDITRPPPGGVADVVLSGSLGSHIPGVPLAVVVTDPDGTPKSFESAISKGRYKSVITINENSLPGTYEISLSHGGAEVGSVSFEVSVPGIPDWVKTDARKWSSELVSDDEFARGIRHLVESGLISPSDHEGQNIPDWVKNGARWWADDLISDEDFVESIQYLVKKGIIRV